IDDGDIASYSWDFNGDGVEDSNIANPSYNFDVDGIGSYTVTLSVSSLDGCSNTSSQEITLYNSPTDPEFEYAASSLCSNSDITFTNLTHENGASDAVSYLWDFGDGTTSSDKNPVYAFADAGTKTVSLTAMIPGCTTSVYSDDIEIIEGPTVAFSYTNNCFEEAIQFTDASTGSDITTYTWDFGDETGSSTDQNPTYTFSATGDYEIRLTVSNLANCETSSTQIITVSDSDKADFSYDQTIENIPVNFTGEDLSLADDYITDWAWDFDGLGSSDQQNPQFTFDNPGDYEVTLAARSNQGCDELVTKTVSIQQASAPTASFALEPTACQNETISINNNSINADSFLWDFCSGDLLENGTLNTDIATLNAASKVALRTIKDQENFFSFISVFNSANKKIYRLDYGNDISSNPTVNDLGNIGGVLTGPYDLDFIQENDTWYALLNDFSSSIVWKITFANGIDSPHTNIEAITIDNPALITQPRGIKIVKEGENIFTLISNNSGNKTTLLSFGNSINNDATAKTFDVDGNALGVELIYDNNSWHGYIVSNDGTGIKHLAFDGNLSQDPTIEDLTLDVDITNGTYFRVNYDAGNFYGILATKNGSFY
ncbi:PKD domain-containing protein, partial [Gilvimarinus agarilyticus]|uniref:PKD domain-containing protein n=1 Tax=Gilvimarinus sp. 2_MG-2023 TaxID=3062666 RepID=UPI001C090C86